MNRWDQAKEKCTGRDALANQINSYLNDYRAKILEIRRALLVEGFAATPNAILNRLKHPSCVCKMLMTEFKGLCKVQQQRVEANLITQLTANKFHRLYRYMELFNATVYKTNDLSLTMLDNTYIEKLYLFLLNNTDCHHNGAINLLSCLRMFAIKCKKKKWLQDNPFDGFNMKEQSPKEKATLTPEEIRIMSAKKCPIIDLKR